MTKTENQFFTQQLYINAIFNIKFIFWVICLKLHCCFHKHLLHNHLPPSQSLSPRKKWVFLHFQSINKSFLNQRSWQRREKCHVDLIVHHTMPRPDSLSLSRRLNRKVIAINLFFNEHFFIYYFFKCAREENMNCKSKKSTNLFFMERNRMERKENNNTNQ